MFTSTNHNSHKEQHKDQLARSEAIDTYHLQNHEYLAEGFTWAQSPQTQEHSVSQAIQKKEVPAIQKPRKQFVYKLSGAVASVLGS